MIWRTSRGANRNRWGVCERFSLPVTERPLGESQDQNRNREIRPSGIAGGPRKRDFVFMTKCARLGSIPTRRPSPGGIAAGCLNGGALARDGGQAGHASSPPSGTSFDACGRKTASGALRASTASG